VHPAVAADDEQAVGHARRDGPEVVARRLEVALVAQALRDVDGERHPGLGLPAGAVDEGQAHEHRDRRAVPAVEQHLPRREAVLGHPAVERRHLDVVVRVDDARDVGAEGLGGGDAVQALGRPVELDDPPLEVRGDDGGVHLVEQVRAEARLARAPWRSVTSSWLTTTRTGRRAVKRFAVSRNQRPSDGYSCRQCSSEPSSTPRRPVDRRLLRRVLRGQSGDVGDVVGPHAAAAEPPPPLVDGDDLARPR
jgi:hypothetical protein